MNMAIPSPTAVDAPDGNDGAAPLGARISRLRIRHLQLLDHIERQGSLSAAAAAIGVSQPGATNMLHEMEDAFGLPLIDRAPRGGRLNAAGAQALGRLRVALGALAAAKDALRTQPDLPLLRIGVLPLVGIDALCRVVAELEAEEMLPRLTVRLGTVSELLSLLVDGEVDCVVSSLDSKAPSEHIQRFRMTPLWEERLVVVAARGNPLVRRRDVGLEELLQHPWILMPARSANRHALERMFLRAGLAPPQARIETDSFHIGLGLAASSRMLTVVPDSVQRRHADRIRPVRISRKFQPSAMSLITLRDVPTLPLVNLLAAKFKRCAPDGQGALTKVDAAQDQRQPVPARSRTGVGAPAAKASARARGSGGG